MEERKYTALSGRAWERIAGQDMSPSEAVRYFSQDLCPRTFGEVLSGLMARQGLDREALIGRLWALRGGDIQRESVRRRVSMWLSAAQPAAECIVLQWRESDVNNVMDFASVFCKGFV